MKKKAELKYLDKEWVSMKIHLKDFLETGEQEASHKFRIQVKKLRALLILLSHTSGQHGLLENFKPVRKIFKKAGIIREAFINLQVAQKYDIDDAVFLAGEQQKIDNGIAAFQQKERDFLKTLKKSHKKILHHLTPVHNKAIQEFYNKQLQDIAINMIVSGFSEDMHTNRKLIKILVYNYKLACQALDGSATLNINYMNKLQAAIGDWHDNLLTAELLATHDLQNRKVITSINRKNAGVKRSISQLADDFLTKATSMPEETLN